jgi:hypothetical protein
MPHPIALTLTPDGLAVVDYGGAPGERGKGELRLIRGVGSDALADTGSLERARPSRLLASGLDGPTGLARLPDGRLLPHPVIGARPGRRGRRPRKQHRPFRPASVQDRP